MKISFIAKSENALLTIISNLESVGIETFVRFLHSLNAYSIIFVTLGGIEISLIAEHENA